ncbi:MAG: hypothetical protein JNJ58_10725 [Chitinophagaceae bacterium]|nr:hypothetical protein [Chitinophagaceae bacterium]
MSDYLKYTTGGLKGSIYVFQDSITQKIDTLKVTNNRMDKIRKFIGPFGNTESMEVRFMRLTGSEKVGTNPAFFIEYMASAKLNRVSAWIMLYKKDSVLNFDSRLFTNDFIDESSIQQPYKPLIVTEHTFWGFCDSINVKGKTYFQVYENLTKVSNIDSATESTCHTYFSIDYGLLKFSLKDSKQSITKELIYTEIKRE